MRILGFLVALVFCLSLTVPAAQADVTIPPIPVPTVTVTLPVVTLPPVTPPPKTVTVPGPTIYIPQPTRTVTLRPPIVTHTVYLPGGTKTIYVTGPGHTKTVTRTGQPLPTPGATSQVTAGATVTATATVTRHGPVRHDIVSIKHPPTHISTPAAVGYSFLVIAVVSGLIILGLWLGYILGYKDSQRKEMRFLSALRDQFYYKGKHR